MHCTLAVGCLFLCLTSDTLGSLPDCRCIVHTHVAHFGSLSFSITHAPTRRQRDDVTQRELRRLYDTVNAQPELRRRVRRCSPAAFNSWESFESASLYGRSRAATTPAPQY